MIKGVKIGKFWFSPQIPDEFMQTVQELILPLEWMIPSWCEEVRVHWSDTGDNDGASYFSAYVSTYYQYRWAKVVVCSIITSEEPEERKITMRHEMSHIVNAPLVMYFKDALDALTEKEDDPIRKFIDAGLRERYEAVTEDLARIITRGQEISALPDDTSNSEAEE